MFVKVFTFKMNLFIDSVRFHDVEIAKLHVYLYSCCLKRFSIG